MNAKNTRFDKGKYQNLLTSAMSCTDEAFGILLVVNYEDRWRSQHEAGERQMGESQKSRASKWAEAKYTSATDGSRRGNSWSQEGMKKFNALAEMVKEQRAEAESGAEVDMDLLVWCRAMAGMPPYGTVVNGVTGGTDEDNDEEEEIEAVGEGDIFEV